MQMSSVMSSSRTNHMAGQPLVVLRADRSVANGQRRLGVSHDATADSASGPSQDRVLLHADDEEVDIAGQVDQGVHWLTGEHPSLNLDVGMLVSDGLDDLVESLECLGVDLLGILAGNGHGQ